jgi:glyoxylate reductase
MQPHSYLVNCSRGDVVDEEALIDLLSNNGIAGAGLDVYQNEPEIPAKLRKLTNTVLLPHICSATIEGRQDMGQKVIINIQTFIDGHTPPDRVVQAML